MSRDRVKAFSGKKYNVKDGIQWNLVSYAITGVLTLLSYCLIVWFHGKAELGAYNIVLSIYMTCGHIGVFGLQSTSIYYVPRGWENKDKLGICFFSFLFIAVTVSIVLSILVNRAAPFLGSCFFKSEYISYGMQIMAPAIILFAVNKLIGGFLNGMGKMRRFALLQTVRYLFIALYLSVAVCLRLEFRYVFWAFIISESCTLFVGILLLKKYIEVKRPNRVYVLEGFKFGSRAMLGNVISDINTKIDVMMLGMLCGEAVTGLYSFVTMIVEGMIAVLLVFRANFNPVFANLLFQNDYKELREVLQSHKKNITIFIGGLSMLVLGVYSMFCLLLLDKVYVISILAVAIILAGCIVMAPYFVFGNVCTLKGKPLIDTGGVLITILVNIVLNYFLVIKYQVVGAALATSISYMIYAALTHCFVNGTINSLKDD